MRERLSIAHSNYGRIYASALKLLYQLTPEKTYATIVNEAKKLIGAKHGTILLVEDNELKRVYASSPVIYKIRPRKRGYTYRVYKKNEPYIISRDEFIKIHPELIKLNVGSDIGLPILYKNKPIGVLSLFSDRKKIFTKKDIVILFLFCKAISVALRNTQLYAYAQKSLDERDLFISMAAHEIKTPLTTIFIYSQLLLRKEPGPKYSDIQIKMKLSNEIRRLTNLVNELLQINQIKIGSLKFVFKKCDLCSIVEGAIAAFENIHVTYHVNFRNELKNKFCFINGDFDKIFQVITNLLNNAAKFSPKDTPIDIVLKYESSRYILTITDYGPGISKKDLPRIFERFYKGDSQDKDGLGLGLFLVKNIIDRHDGKITVSSQFKQKTTFTVTLPIYIDGKIKKEIISPLQSKLTKSIIKPRIVNPVSDRIDT